MKKILAAVCITLLFVLIAVITAGESYEDYGHYIPKDRDETVKTNRMIPIETNLLATWAHVCVAYDSHTGVMYLVSRAGGVCPMIDVDGKPLLYAP